MNRKHSITLSRIILTMNKMSPDSTIEMDHLLIIIIITIVSITIISIIIIIIRNFNQTIRINVDSMRITIQLGVIQTTLTIKQLF